MMLCGLPMRAFGKPLAVALAHLYGEPIAHRMDNRKPDKGR